MVCSELCTPVSTHVHVVLYTASQSWLLSRYLPLMIGGMVPEDDVYRANYTLLVKIMVYLFSPKINEDDAAILQEMIMIHHQEFVTLYPSCSTTPKVHYLIHMPRLICQILFICQGSYASKTNCYEQLCRICDDVPSYL